MFTLCSFRLISPAEPSNPRGETRTARREIKSARNSATKVSRLNNCFVEIVVGKKLPHVLRRFEMEFHVDALRNFQRETIAIAMIPQL